MAIFERKSTIELQGLLAEATGGNWYVDGRMIAANPCVTLALLCQSDSFGGIHDAPNAAANGALIAIVPALANEVIETRDIIRSLLTYIEEIECSLDNADQQLAAEGGCSTREWREGAPEFLPRAERLSYVRDAYTDHLGQASAYLASVT